MICIMCSLVALLVGNQTRIVTNSTSVAALPHINILWSGKHLTLLSPCISGSKFVYRQVLAIVIVQEFSEGVSLASWVILLLYI